MPLSSSWILRVWQARWFRLSSCIDLFWALVLFGIVYRARLAAGLLGGQGPAVHSSWRELLGYVFWEVSLAIGAVLSLAIVYGLGLLLLYPLRLLSPDGRSGAAAIVRQLFLLVGRSVMISCVLLLFWAVGSLYHTHFTALFVMHTGLTYDLYLEGVSGGFIDSMLAFAGSVTTAEAITIATPLMLFLVLRLTPGTPGATVTALGAAVGLALAITLPAVVMAATPPNPMVQQSPIYFLAHDAWRSFNRAPPKLDPLPVVRLASKGGRRATKRVVGKIPFAAQLTSVSFIHPDFVNGIEAHKPFLSTVRAAAKSEPHWNIVIVLMESAGLRYFTTRHRGVYAMPYLRQLAENGLVATNHFSPSNSSPRSIFALVSGLYPMPEVRIFAVRRGLHYPSLFTLLGPRYQSLWVMPTSAHWYFPGDYLSRHGPNQIVDFGGLPFSKSCPERRFVRDEPTTVSYFLRRLRQLDKSRPFAAVYYTFAGHWPYPDFGSRYHLVPSTGLLNRYLNNLYLIDKQIERLVTHLKRDGVFDRTILVFVGDHGEAFGQHAGNWTHSRHSFNENYQTPFILYQPRLFKPRKIAVPTSHVDLLPTLLDALGVHYNPHLLQGESLFQDVQKRKYIFLYGNEDTLSSISRAGIKLQLSFKEHRCWAYDLAHDPGETKPLRCKTFGKQHRATRLYQRFQVQTLRRYNQALQRGQPFFGQRH